MHGNSDLFQDYGLGTLRIREDRTTDPCYFRKQGFTLNKGVLERSL